MPFKRGLGRSPRVIVVRVSEDAYEWLLKQAEESGDSISSVVRRIIREAMRRGG